MRTWLRQALLLLALPLAGVPACADAQTPRPDIAVYGNLPGFEMAALSPSGDRVALVGVISERRRLIVTDKDGTPLAAIAIGDSKLRSIDWAGEDRVLLRYSGTVNLGMGFTAAKAELSSMLVIPVHGGKPWVVFDKKSNITGGIRGFYGAVERDGHWYGYFGGITLEDNGRGDKFLNSTNAELYEVDLDSGKPRRIAIRANPETYRSWLVGQDGSVTATLDYVSRSGDWSIENGQGKKIASGRSRLGGIDLISLGRTPGTIVYSVVDDTTREGHWFEIPLAGGGATEILADVAVLSYHIDLRSRRLIGYVQDADQPEDHFYDPRLDKAMVAARRAFPGLTVRLIDWNVGFDRLIVRTEGVGDPLSWWKVDLRKKTADPLGVSYPGALDHVGPMRMVRYKAADGLEIAGVLTLPPGRKPTNLPVIVFPHGGPGARDYPGFDWWAQAFAVRGYAVFQPNFRGSTGYGTAFRRAGDGEWGRAMQTDISDGLNALVRLGIVDPKRACIMGASYGGYAALAGVTLQHGLYRCAVAVAGVSDVQRMYNTDVSESGQDPTMIRALKAEIGSGRALKDISPIRFASQADAPVLLIHGKDDTVVLYDQSDDMADALRKAGKPVEFVTLPGEDHWLSKSETRLSMLKAAIDFVERNNPPDPAP